MKKTLSILILIFSSLQSFACEKDSIFDIRLQHDSLSQSLNVEFKNITNDTITLITQFDNFFNEIRKSPGFRINFYRNDKPFIPSWGELPKCHYIIDRGKIEILPCQKIVLKIQLPFGLFLKSDKHTKSLLFITLELNYRYFVRGKSKGGTNYFKSKCFELKY